MLENHEVQVVMLDYLERHRRFIVSKMPLYKNITTYLDIIISFEKDEKQIMKNSRFEIEEKSLEPLLIAGFRMKGKYSDCGKGFSQIGRKFGRFINGKPFCLFFDNEYKENDADFEACMPIKQGKPVESISVRELAGGKCISLLHKGPYGQLGRSYKKILEYAKNNHYELATPSREVYLKGPGMIFKGNSQKYLTEIQIIIKD